MEDWLVLIGDFFFFRSYHNCLSVSCLGCTHKIWFYWSYYYFLNNYLDCYFLCIIGIFICYVCVWWLALWILEKESCIFSCSLPIRNGFCFFQSLSIPFLLCRANAVSWSTHWPFSGTVEGPYCVVVCWNSSDIAGCARSTGEISLQTALQLEALVVATFCQEIDDYQQAF